jgi:hypothetical protein
MTEQENTPRSSRRSEAKKKSSLPLIFAGIACILLAAGYYVIFIAPSIKEGTGWKLASMDGDVSFLRGAESVKPEQGMAIIIGDKIQTSSDGKAEISALRNKTSIKLASGSSVEFGKNLAGPFYTLDKGKAAFTLLPGAVNKSVRVYTPHVEVKVTGTVFNVFVYEKKTVVAIQKGKVAVTDLQQRVAMNTKGGTYVVVEQGKKIESFDGEYIPPEEK